MIESIPGCIAALASLLVVGCHGTRIQPNASQQSAKRQIVNRLMEADPLSSDENAWKGAEEIAREYYLKKGFKVETAERVRSLPYLIEVGFDYGGLYAVVFGGRVLDSKGVTALANYFRDAHFLSRKEVTADVFIRLIEYFDAFPPGMKGKSYYFDVKARPDLCPRLQWEKDGARFVLDYATSNASPPGFGGTKANADMVAMEEWTLQIPTSYHLEWTQRLFETHR